MGAAVVAHSVVTSSPDQVSPEQIAAIARARGPDLSERLTLYADAWVDALARQLELVAWDREQLLGQVQTRVAELHRARPSVGGGPPVRVVERRAQPLESIDVAWSWLRRGRRVRLELEPEACTAAADLLDGIAALFPPRVLEVGSYSGDAPPGDHVDGGVEPPGARVAMIDANADRELAAYVLARTSLRRSGVDPRGVKVAYIAGDIELFQRHVRRLWVGATVGPAADPESFAGPVRPSTRTAYLEAYERWDQHPDVSTWCRGGVLQRSGDPGCFLAPAAFHTHHPCPDLPRVGPMLVVVSCNEEALRAVARDTLAQRGQLVQIGGRPGDFRGPVRHVRGALLVERLPPGLPEPRPV